MKKDILQVDSIPINVEDNTIIEINTRDVTYFTHSLFKYPCKFIPQVPKWAIEKYTNENDLVLDCFAGSGTTLVEAVMLNRNALGVDFDKLSQLLCLTKTKLLTKNEIQDIKKMLDNLFLKKSNIEPNLPDLHNIQHWFCSETIRDLSNLKNNIDTISNQNIKNFFLVCFASIIKKVSNADDNSPKPYVSSRFKKQKYFVKDLFSKAVNNYVEVFEKNQKIKHGTAKIISQDARNIGNKDLNNKIDLAITSPPYINAFDYVCSLRLENAWLGFWGDSNITTIKKNQIGTETIGAELYKKDILKTGIKLLDEVLFKIYSLDKKRAYVVLKYFQDMEENIISVRDLLKINAHYIIVVGDSVIREFIVPTHNILIEIAQRNGFVLTNTFSYIIKNRYLRIPRAGRGGFIKYDWIIDLKKLNRWHKKIEIKNIG